MEKEDSRIKELINSQISSLQNTVAELKEEITELQACVSSRVFFQAGLDTEGSYGTGRHVFKYGNEVVVYSDVYLSLRSNYDPRTGVFTAMEAGLYKFDVHVTSELYKDFYMHIEHNDVKVAGVLSLDGGRLSASTSVILHLVKGDTVKVVTSRDWKDAALYQSCCWAAKTNTFSGVLLSSDKCLPPSPFPWPSTPSTPPSTPRPTPPPFPFN